MVRVVREVYERYGFEPLETPAFENIETLIGKYGDEGNQLIFKIFKRGEQEGSGAADLAFRYDLTVPLARVVAQYQNELPRFFKRYQIQPVWRADRPARGRFREFYQCDIDAIGSTSPVKKRSSYGGQRSARAPGIRRLRNPLESSASSDGSVGRRIFDRRLHTDALVALDKFDKVGCEGVLKELDQRGIALIARGSCWVGLRCSIQEKWLEWLRDHQFMEVDVRVRPA